MEHHETTFFVDAGKSISAEVSDGGQYYPIVLKIGESKQHHRITIFFGSESQLTEFCNSLEASCNDHFKHLDPQG